MFTTLLYYKMYRLVHSERTWAWDSWRLHNFIHRWMKGALRYVGVLFLLGYHALQFLPIRSTQQNVCCISTSKVKHQPKSYLP